ncbi:uncharacterized protein EAF01_003715 [Botrytis porri]|uniref:uncharacterized protein n=1 Tax=Botrytis porri TaxID=87229 RepID=UPI001901F262|nr:uncharacterized protein EAF01_003715 [Botrytis porri]KAF7909997.1 hypothetical protein EAF01_003715 [Botrytis porri]
MGDVRDHLAPNQEDPKEKNGISRRRSDLRPVISCRPELSIEHMKSVKPHRLQGEYPNTSRDYDTNGSTQNHESSHSKNVYTELILEDHLPTVIGTPRGHRCPFPHCGALHSSAESLHAHREKHTKELSMKCSICIHLPPARSFDQAWKHLLDCHNRYSQDGQGVSAIMKAPT